MHVLLPVCRRADSLVECKPHQKHLCIAHIGSQHILVDSCQTGTAMSEAA